MGQRLDGSWSFTGPVQFPGGITTTFDRTILSQESLVVYSVPLASLRVHDEIATNLPGTAATDDLALKGGTFGADAPSIQTLDSKNTSATQYARFQFVLPAEYDAGQTVTLRANAGMNTTIASSSATIDFEVFAADRSTGVSSDLCATSATSINSLTLANKDFTVTATSLAPGDVLDVRMTIAIVDSATATAVIGEVGALEFLLDIRG